MKKQNIDSHLTITLRNKLARNLHFHTSVPKIYLQNLALVEKLNDHCIKSYDPGTLLNDVSIC